MKSPAVIIRSIFWGIAGFWSTTVYSQQMQPLTYYISPYGNSNNPGTIDRPFARPEDVVAAMEKIKGPIDANVFLRGGNYYFSSSLVIKGDEKDSTRHIRFTAWQNEKPVFAGSRRLDNSRFSPIRDPEILKRLPEPARAKTVVINLKDAGISDYGKRVVHGYKNIHPAALELFYNDIPLTVARYPNEGFLPIGTVLDPGSSPRSGDRTLRGAKFIFSDSRMNNWQQADNAWVGGYFSFGYSDDYLKVDSFDLADKTIRLKQPALYSVFSSDNGSTEPLRNAQKIRGFYVYNLLEELDQPGEYFLDEASGNLYLWPPDNALATADIEVSMLETPIAVLSHTANIQFTGITFSWSRGMGILLDNTIGTVISHCVFDDLGTVAISTGNPLTGPRPVSNNTGLQVGSCRIYNTGTGAVLLDGGDRRNLTPANNSLDNCDIYNYSRLNRTFCPAVSLDGVGNRITHCNIHDAADQAIIFYGNDHTIAFNHISNVVSYMTDAGAVGTGRDIGSTGNTISDNFFDHIVSAINASVCAVYLDDGSSGMEVDGNIFYKVGTAGTYHFGAIHVNGGSNNTFWNNYFIDCPQAFSNSPWNDPQWKSFITNTQIPRVYRPGVDIRSDAYTKKYPYLVALTDSNAMVTRQNYSFNTLAFRVAVFSTGAGYMHKNVFNTQQDPGFADLTKPDLTLKKVPATLQQAADWKPIPFHQIGIIASTPSPSPQK